MAKIILKSPYMKPNAKSHTARYVKYIATREGVQMPTASKGKEEATDFQKRTITNLLSEYPDTKELYEYADYMKKPTRENSDEFIIRVAETHSELLGTRQRYVDYIATRPNVVSISAHGLFSDLDMPIDLKKVADEVSNYEGNIWTHIISLRREDAERLGYNNVDEWQELIRSQRNVIAKNMKINPENFRWYAAFHNADHHPHVHMLAYSIDPKEAYLSKQGIENIKSVLALKIFRQDLLQVYERQTKSRDNLRADSREMISEIISDINIGEYDNQVVSNLLESLSKNLSEHKGKKQYGYLRQEVKSLVDRIVDELSSDNSIEKLYDLWYEQKNEIIKAYTDEVPKKIPLSQNKEFKSIKNAVIQEALNLFLHDRIDFKNDFDKEMPELEALNSEVKDGEQSISNVNAENAVKTSSSNIKSVSAQGAFRLLTNLTQLLNNRLEKDNGGKLRDIDSKEKQKENEKKQAHGLRI